MAKRTGIKFVLPAAMYAKLVAEKEGKQALMVGARYLVSKIQRNINTSTRSKGPSSPGEFPHKDTGKLQQSIREESTGPMSVGVGTNLDYGKDLELGTDKVAARPFLRRTFSEELSAVKNVVKKALQ